MPTEDQSRLTEARAHPRIMDLWWALRPLRSVVRFMQSGAHPDDESSAMLAAMTFMLFLGPVEEFGWRGLALPLLQRKLAPIWAGLFLGVIWGLWHFPAFLLGGTPQGAWSFAPFFVGSIAVSMIMTQLFNASRGSILLAALFHFQLINPVWPDAQPYDTLFFAVAALLVVWFNRKAMFSREQAVTEVVPQAADRASRSG